MTERLGPLRLPPRDHLPKTGPVDAIGWYYRPGVAWVMRMRLGWVREGLLGRSVDRILEVGYGSGIFQYELTRLARRSVGIDVHRSAHVVRGRLEQHGVGAALVVGDGCTLPFARRSFDAIVVVSALEFVPDPAACLTECVRVLRAGGRLLCVTPRTLAWADRALAFLVSVEPESQFSGGRERVRAAVETVLSDARRLRRPAWVPRALAPYELVIYDRPA